MGRKISRVYYSSKGLWKGLPSFKKLPKEGRMAEDVAKLWPMNLRSCLKKAECLRMLQSFGR